MNHIQSLAAAFFQRDLLDAAVRQVSHPSSDGSFVHHLRNSFCVTTNN
jgi:hypothetical protein